MFRSSLLNVPLRLYYCMLLSYTNLIQQIVSLHFSSVLPTFLILQALSDKIVALESFLGPENIRLPSFILVPDILLR